MALAERIPEPLRETATLGQKRDSALGLGGVG